MLMKVRCTFYNLMKVQLFRKNENKIFVQCCRYKYASFFTTKEMSFCHKLYFSNLFIFATQCRYVDISNYEFC